MYDADSVSLLEPGVPRHGRANLVGLWTLYTREVRRFATVWIQTVMAPVVTALLFLAVFSVALGDLRGEVHGVPFVQFLVPGLIMMTIVQNAFANASSSLLVAKMQGNVIDFLMPPLSPAELNAGLTGGGLTRGLVVGAGAFLGMSLFVPIHVHDVGAALFYAATAACLMAQVGLLGGIWARKFDHLGALTSFVITPLTLLSGTFYPVSGAPAPLRILTSGNPFFHMVDGFRYALTGHAEGSLAFGAVLLVTLTVVMGTVCQIVLTRGYRLKS